jgi:macrodomain Ter protein organizer (MatP/YcbG family)
VRLTSSGKQAELSASIDLDMANWLKAEAARQSTHVSTIVRQLIRAAMGCEKTATDEAA